MALDRTLTAKGDVNGDGELGFDDVLLLSQVASGTRSRDDGMVDSTANLDVDGNGALEQEDVSSLVDAVFGSSSADSLREQHPGFAIAALSVDTFKPGMTLEVTVTGEVSDIVDSVRFGSMMAPVMERLDASRLVTYVPLLEPGPIELVLIGKGWASQPYAATVEALPELTEPVGTVASDSIAKICDSFTTIRTEVLPELLELGLLNSQESDSLGIDIQRLDSLLQLSLAKLSELPEEQRKLIDQAFLVQGVEAQSELAASSAKSAALSLYTFRSSQSMSLFSTTQSQAISPDHGQAFFFTMVTLDNLSAALGAAKTATGVAAALLTVTTGPGGVPLWAVTIGISAIENVVDGLVPTDLARLRAVFKDGGASMGIGESKQVIFLGDFRTEASKLEAIVGVALDAALALAPGIPDKVEIVEELLKILTDVGIETLYDSTAGEVLNKISESWAYNVEVPIEYYTQFSVSRSATQIIWNPLVFPTALFAGTTPRIYDASGRRSSQASFNAFTSVLTAGNQRSGTSLKLGFDGFNIRGADTWYGSIGTIGLKFPQKISDEEYEPFGLSFDPPSGSPQAEEKLIPLYFKNESGTLRIRPSLSSASWTVTGEGQSLSGTGSQDRTVKPGSYSIDWGVKSGYSTPADETKTLTDGGTATFTGTYSAENGTLRISPSLASASWSVSGPTSFSGSGSNSYSVPAGSYTVTWGSVSGYNRPAPQTKNVSSGATTTFTGTYTETVGVGTLGGIVKDGVNGTGISGASVTFYSSSNALLGSTTTNSSGIYSKSIAEGNARVVISKSGYVSTELFAEVVANQTTEADAVLFAPDEPGNGTISGRIRDALSGGGISGATVRLRSGVSNRTGAILQSATANSAGAFSFTAVGGSYTLEAVATGYADGFANAVAVGGRSIADQDVNLTPALTSGEWRIVLTWGASPADLDAHLAGPLAGGSQFHVDFDTKTPTGSGASLDIDDLSSYGPETITLTGLRSGVYRYWVHDYSNKDSSTSTALSNDSSAKVVVWRASGSGTYKAAEYNVPTGKVGNAWVAFEIDGATGSITSRNEVKNIENAGVVPTGGVVDPVVPASAEVPVIIPSSATATAASAQSALPRMSFARVASEAASDTTGPDLSHWDEILNRPDSLEVVVDALPAGIGSGASVTIPVYLRDRTARLGGYELLLQYDEAAVELLEVTPATDSQFESGYFFTEKALASGSHRVVGWTSSRGESATWYEHVFDLKLKVLAPEAAPSMTFRWQRAFSSETAELAGNTLNLVLSAGESVGDSPFQIWASRNQVSVADRMAMGQPPLLAFALGWEKGDSGAWVSPTLKPGVAGLEWLIPQNLEALDLTWTLQGSSDLSVWEDLDQVDPQISPFGEGRQLLNLPVGDLGHTFYRLKVQL